MIAGGAGGKAPPANEKFRLLGREDPLEEVMVIHSSILALENPIDRRAW